jgi:hypothetical protein
MIAPKPVPKAAFAKPVTKAAFATESSDVNKFILKMAEIHGDETGALLYKQRPRVRSGLFEPVEDRTRRQAESDEGWMREVRSQLETPTATTLDAINAATTTASDVGAHPKAAVDATTNDDDAMNDQKEVGIIIRTLEIYGIELGPRLHNGYTTINAKTTPCIVNRPCGSRHETAPRRIRHHGRFLERYSLLRWIQLVGIEKDECPRAVG